MSGRPVVGDIVTDERGQWRVVSVARGKVVSRVRVGSLAERVHFPEPRLTGPDPFRDRINPPSVEP